MISDGQKQALLNDLQRLHTTPLGEVRIRRNLSLQCEDVTAWCRELICAQDAVISRQGKNWYIRRNGVTLTVNARSLTIITAHKGGAEP
ncbi:MAG: DUF3781 domain-containing protein [Oscillospiraceae bacterium]|nr:DUF3781 domain-containing protein [Oscillospiraceae bacterium]